MNLKDSLIHTRKGIIHVMIKEYQVLQTYMNKGYT
jgi:hypothetical protein